MEEKKHLGANIPSNGNSHSQISDFWRQFGFDCPTIWGTNQKIPLVNSIQISKNHDFSLSAFSSARCEKIGAYL
jgi:hypothetical protein